MNSPARPYQGYPYVKPSVTDVPSVDPETAARWANLPKKAIVPNITGLPDNRTGQNYNERASGKEKKDKTERPVVYINMPGLGTACHSRVQNANEDTRSKEKKDPTEMPVVYIDLPATDATNSRTQPEPELTSEPESEEDPAELPVVYIDLPSGDESIVSGPKQETSTANSWTQSGPSASHQQYRPPVSFDFTSPSSSGYSSQSSGLPPSMQKETSIYHRPIPSDDFSLSPIPVSEFPEPPPAYSEVAAVQPAPSTSTVPVPPRTQVFGPNIGTPGSAVLAPNRLHCHHCGHTVSTIVELKSGLVTHLSALVLLMCCLIPCIPIVYCTTPLKYQNYYCPDCYKQIAYKVPLISQGVQIFKE